MATPRLIIVDGRVVGITDPARQQSIPIGSSAPSRTSRTSRRSPSRKPDEVFESEKLQQSFASREARQQAEKEFEERKQREAQQERIQEIREAEITQEQDQQRPQFGTRTDMGVQRRETPEVRTQPFLEKRVVDTFTPRGTRKEVPITRLFYVDPTGEGVQQERPATEDEVIFFERRMRDATLTQQPPEDEGVVRRIQRQITQSQRFQIGRAKVQEISPIDFQRGRVKAQQISDKDLIATSQEFERLEQGITQRTEPFIGTRPARAAGAFTTALIPRTVGDVAITGATFGAAAAIGGVARGTAAIGRTLKVGTRTAQVGRVVGRTAAIGTTGVFAIQTGAAIKQAESIEERAAIAGRATRDVAAFGTGFRVGRGRVVSARAERDLAKTPTEVLVDRTMVSPTKGVDIIQAERMIASQRYIAKVRQPFVQTSSGRVILEEGTGFALRIGRTGRVDGRLIGTAGRIQPQRTTPRIRTTREGITQVRDIPGVQAGVGRVGIRDLARIEGTIRRGVSFPTAKPRTVARLDVAPSIGRFIFKPFAGIGRQDGKIGRFVSGIITRARVRPGRTPSVMARPTIRGIVRVRDTTTPRETIGFMGGTKKSSQRFLDQLYGSQQEIISQAFTRVMPRKAPTPPAVTTTRPTQVTRLEPSRFEAMGTYERTTEMGVASPQQMMKTPSIQQLTGISSQGIISRGRARVRSGLAVGQVSRTRQVQPQVTRQQTRQIQQQEIKQSQRFRQAVSQKQLQRQLQFPMLKTITLQRMTPVFRTPPRPRFPPLRPPFSFPELKTGQLIPKEKKKKKRKDVEIIAQDFVSKQLNLKTLRLV